MALANSVAKIKAHFNYGSQGWSESYFMKGSDYTESYNNFFTMMSHRRKFLADGVMLVYAVYSDVFLPRKTKLIIGNPQISTVAPDAGAQLKPHDVESAVRVRLETSDGKHATRLIRGIADEDIADHINNYTFARKLLEQIPLTANADDTRQVAWDNFVNCLVHFTIFATKTLAPAGQMITESWTDAAVRGVSNRKTGAPHGLTRGRRRKKKDEVPA